MKHSYPRRALHDYNGTRDNTPISRYLLKFKVPDKMLIQRDSITGRSLPLALKAFRTINPDASLKSIAKVA